MQKFFLVLEPSSDQKHTDVQQLQEKEEEIAEERRAKVSSYPFHTVVAVSLFWSIAHVFFYFMPVKQVLIFSGFYQFQTLVLRS